MPDSTKVKAYKLCWLVALLQEHPSAFDLIFQMYTFGDEQGQFWFTIDFLFDNGAIELMAAAVAYG